MTKPRWRLWLGWLVLGAGLLLACGGMEVRVVTGPTPTLPAGMGQGVAPRPDASKIQEPPSWAPSAPRATVDPAAARRAMPRQLPRLIQVHAQVTPITYGPGCPIPEPWTVYYEAKVSHEDQVRQMLVYAAAGYTNAEPPPWQDMQRMEPVGDGVFQAQSDMGIFVTPTDTYDALYYQVVLTTVHGYTVASPVQRLNLQPCPAPTLSTMISDPGAVQACRLMLLRLSAKPDILPSIHSS